MSILTIIVYGLLYLICILLIVQLLYMAANVLIQLVPVLMWVGGIIIAIPYFIYCFFDGLIHPPQRN